MKKKYTHILMDLDGTVIDSGEGITKTVQYALSGVGIQVNDLTELYRFIGPPLSESFREFYGLTEEQIKQATEKYRERYDVTGMYENVVYEGIKELLTSWRKMGKKVMLCTSKPEFSARKILEHFHLSECFDFVGGATFDGSRSEKEDVIKYILETNNLKNLSEMIMVGDRKYDIRGARNVGIDSVGVLYGYGNREEFELAGADYIVENISDLRNIFK